MTFRPNLDKNYINYKKLITDYMKKDISVAEQENRSILLMVYMNYFNNVYWYIDYKIWAEFLFNYLDIMLIYLNYYYYVFYI